MEEKDQANNKRAIQDLSLLKSKRVKSVDDTRNRRKNIMSGAQQLEIITKKRKNYEGSDYYLLSKDWYAVWEHYCLGLRITPPGAIDNSSLLLENKEIKPNVQKEDYFIVPAPALKYLRIW